MVIERPEGREHDFRVLLERPAFAKVVEFGPLVGLLCDEAGIGSAIRSIEEPIFDAVDQSVITTSLADWNAGTLQNISSLAVQGSIRKKWIVLDDFSDGDYTSDPVWTLNGGTYIINLGKFTALLPIILSKSTYVPRTKDEVVKTINLPG